MFISGPIQLSLYTVWNSPSPRCSCCILEGSVDLILQDFSVPLLLLSIYTGILVGFNSVGWEGLFCSASSLQPVLSSITTTLNQQKLLPIYLINLVHSLLSVL